MIHGIDPRTREQADYYGRKARTNDRIGLAAKAVLVVTIVGIILAAVL